MNDAEFAGQLSQEIAISVEVRRALATRDRAVRVVSHDLGNPLTSIEICAQTLLDSAAASHADVRRMARIIRRSAACMRAILRDLADRTSLDAGRIVLDRAPTAVRDILGSTQTVLGPVAHHRGLVLVVESEPDLPCVDADEQRVLQVLSNLVGNAVRFTPVGGRVAVTAHSAPPEPVVRFAVRDTGRGIPPDDLAHVFDWFWRSGRAGPGTGFGLGIAKSLVEAHGGRIGVHNNPDAGATFWFTLPVAREVEQP